jgi:trimeric autotransporter adhesin
MKKYLLLSIFLWNVAWCTAQGTGIGTSNPDASAALDITHTAKGLLIPRMATAHIAAVANPAKGLLVYDSSLNQLMVNMGTPTAPNWQTIVTGSGWSLTGNGGTSGTNFIGTTDIQPLLFRINNQWAGKIDYATSTVFLGYGSGAKDSGYTSNTGIGYKSLNANKSGFWNTANGSGALQNNLTGFSNTACGQDALFSNTTGQANTANGYQALHLNTTGSANTANGHQALFSNTGDYNTANGYWALLSNQTGTYNSADGYEAMLTNETGIDNTASGAMALFGNRTGNYNTGVGTNALYNTTASWYNTAIGYNAGSSYDNGYNNVFIGANTDVNGADYYNVIAIGQGTIATGSSVAVFGNSATVTYGGWAGWTNISDGRFKSDIKENVPGLAFLLKLRPVTYNLRARQLDAFIRNKQATGKTPDQRYQKALEDKEKITYTGFVAQEVDSAAAQLGYNFSGVDKPKNSDDYYSLRYGDFVTPLIKAVQELSTDHREIQKQIDELKASIKK